MGKTYRKEFEINTKKFTADVEFYQDDDNEYDLSVNNEIKHGNIVLTNIQINDLNFIYKEFNYQHLLYR